MINVRINRNRAHPRLTLSVFLLGDPEMRWAMLYLFLRNKLAMPRPKPFKTIDELVDLLTIERELKCANVDELRAF